MSIHPDRTVLVHSCTFYRSATSWPHGTPGVVSSHAHRADGFYGFFPQRAHRADAQAFGYRGARTEAADPHASEGELAGDVRWFVTKGWLVVNGVVMW